MKNPERLTLAALKANTASAHVRAEKSGVIADLLRRQATRDSYLLLLRNLQPVYAALEQAIERRSQTPPVSFISFPGVARCATIEADLTHMAGSRWRDMPVTSAAQEYADRIFVVAASQPELLLAHAYVRYFGDLNGGQVLKKLIGEALNIAPESLGFYDFSGVGALQPFLISYREAFERALSTVEGADNMLAEAESAFEFNISVSNACQISYRKLSA